ncbi:MAG: YARHG domain-containing protein [Ferruginibacter sp.]
MNRLKFAAYLIVLFVCSCNQSPSSLQVANSAAELIPDSKLIPIIGSYAGAFGDTKITLRLTKVSKDSVEGRSIVKGYDRPFSGIWTKSDATYIIHAKEPGTDAHDGIFDFSIQANQPETLSGTWKPFNEKISTTAKTFTLTKEKFVYKKDVGQFPQASTRILTEDDVYNLIPEELEIMRNEIFARHGYCFKKQSMRDLFEYKDWYIPASTDVRKDLTEIEKKNIAFIKKFEKYLAKYGDDFGR